MAAWRFLVGIAVMLLLWPELAWSKPRGCFTKAEQNAEQMVRHGLHLREGANGCDGQPWNTGTEPIWQQINTQLGAQFAQQTQIRAAAFDREFEKDADNKLSVWNGRIVMYFRNYPLSAVYCGELKKQLDAVQKGGWGVFARQAGKAVDVIRMDYRLCG